MENSNPIIIFDSVKRYLLDLQDTGVDELKYSNSMIAGKAESACNIISDKSADVESLEDIRNDIGDCKRCQLAISRTNLVFGVGSKEARLMFVGEAPGREEDLQGEPFVGEAGQLLTNIISAMGFTRDEVYICNLLKCRPPNNRNPLNAEIEQCQQFMLRQIKSVKPEVIVALGTFAAQTLLGSKAPISKLRGRFHEFHGIPLMPTFHPAFLLRNPPMKREVWEDVKKVLKRMGLEPPQK